MSMGHKHTNVKCESEKKVAAIAIWSNRNRLFFVSQKKISILFFRSLFLFEWWDDEYQKREKVHIDSLRGNTQTRQHAWRLTYSFWKLNKWYLNFFFNHTHTIYTRTSSIDTMCLCVCVCIECVFFFSLTLCGSFFSFVISNWIIVIIEKKISAIWIRFSLIQFGSVLFGLLFR